MALKKYTGNSDGPGCLFNVVRELEKTDSSNQGYYLKRKYYVYVSKGQDTNFTTSLSVSWNTGKKYSLSKVGNYAEKTETIGWVAYGKSVTLPKISAEYTGGSGTTFKSSLSETTYTVPASEAPYYTITYDTNDGASMASSTQKYQYATSGTIDLSSTVPTRTGYEFLGWSTSKTATTASYQPGGKWKKNYGKNVTLYAVWKEYVLTVNYYSNYATESFGDTINLVDKENNVLIATTTHAYSAEQPNGLLDYSFPTSEMYLLRKGYFSEGNWVTKLPLGGNIVHETTSFSTGQELAQALGKDISLNDDEINIYPQWIANNYTLTLDANGGTVATSSLTLTYESAQYSAIRDFLPNRFGYKFIGWFISPDGGLQIYDENGVCTNDGTYWLDNKYVYLDNLTVYAQWEPSNIVRQKINGEYVLCYIYVKPDGVWKPVITKKKIDGEYKK